MPPRDTFNWSDTSEVAHLAQVRALSPDDLRAMIRTYDWSHYPEAVLGWAMAQKGIDLCSAMVAFFNGEPERFNYMPKHHVPEAYRGAARVLDNICLRINSGFYLIYPGEDTECRDTLMKWLEYQNSDRKEGRRGRWILDERILEPMLKDALRLDRASEADRYQKPSLWRDLLSPILSLGVDRRLLKHKPPRG
ncbi:hypothetical protein SAMN04487859_101189 [Roseovarius lutimaris]|uniref:DUF4274 domain-containing protein n=1 Tax=Roseovarius lutimaris TaxID=1005928 RepID=A0A1I4YFI4_9RHOB|nr:hypothetical protein [Roseovarius lutimaris]SFN36788.1 hypothetical protein SAMN04487859_101189 [Roseovarius lutimaris]